METAVGTGGQGGYTALPDFGRSLNLLNTTRGADYTNQITPRPPPPQIFRPTYAPDKWKLQSSAYGVPPGQFFNLANLNATEVI